MTNRSEPVFSVRLKPVVKSHVSAAGATAYQLRKRRDDLQKQYDQLFNSTKGDINSYAPLTKLSNQIADLNDAIAKAQAQASKEPPPVQDPPDPGEDITHRVLEFEYEDDEKKVDVCRLTLNNSDLGLLDHVICDKGTALLVSWGYAGNMAPQHEVVVQKVTGFLQLKVEAQDKGVLMNKVAKSRTFEDTSYSELVIGLAKEYGYTWPDTIFVDETEEVYPVVTQAGQTDGQFIKKLADKMGFEFYIDTDGFHWHARRTNQKPLRELVYVLPPGVGDITSIDIDGDIHGKAASVSASGVDPVAKKPISAQADADKTPRTVLNSTPEATTAPAAPAPVYKVDPVTLQTTAVYQGAAPQQATPATASSTTGPTSATSQAEAQKQVNGAFKRAQQATMKLNVGMVGDPSIVAKAVVQVGGIGQRLSGRYYINSAKHSLKPGSYTLALKLSTDTTNKGKGGAGAAAKKNDQQAPPATTGDTPPALQPVYKVDPVTLQTTATYVDTGGRSTTPQPTNPQPPK